MRKDELIHEAFRLQPSAISYYVTQQLATIFPNPTLIGSDEPYFNVEKYSKEKGVSKARAMRDRPNISEQHLQAFLQDQYGLIPVTLDFLPLGLDSYAGVYRVVSEQGNAYLLKITSGPFYEPRYLVPRYFKDQGIIAVVDPVHFFRAMGRQRSTGWRSPIIVMNEWCKI